jgi:hypothetical protein
VANLSIAAALLIQRAVLHAPPNILVSRPTERNLGAFCGLVNIGG